jgi:hypothetical protein
MKYSIDIWSGDVPTPHPASCNLIRYLFGLNFVWWNSERTDCNHTRYRITIEEIKE